MFNVLCPSDSAMSPKITGELIRQLRQAMKSCKYFAEPIQAYIVPSGDSHQVLSHLKYTLCTNVTFHILNIAINKLMKLLAAAALFVCLCPLIIFSDLSNFDLLQNAPLFSLSMQNV